jgi:hypothetical protein
MSNHINFKTFSKISHKLRNLYFSLCNQKANPSPDTFPDTLNEIGKIIVWGEQNNSDIF